MTSNRKEKKNPHHTIPQKSKIKLYLNYNFKNWISSWIDEQSICQLFYSSKLNRHSDTDNDPDTWPFPRLKSWHEQLSVSAEHTVMQRKMGWIIIVILSAQSEINKGTEGERNTLVSSKNKWDIKNEGKNNIPG